MKDGIDIIFKIGILAILAGFLMLYAKSSENGRYIAVFEEQQEFIVDSRTGVIYQGGFAMDHIHGKEIDKPTE
ncbi:hypothetical protein [Desulfovibrio inopinatus]|uniref:hypothetical protein n=1 Tax=Desulfovibrio inopinatus TaxID=102109 RepID=UPI00040520DB|nr:hypothetical protein [Desulfovibrio inopinatus]